MSSSRSSRGVCLWSECPYLYWGAGVVASWGPAPITGLCIILLSVCMDKSPRTPVLSGEFPVRSIFHRRLDSWPQFRLEDWSWDFCPFPVARLLCASHLPLLDSPLPLPLLLPAQVCLYHLVAWGQQGVLVLAVLGLTGFAHDKYIIIISWINTMTKYKEKG